MADLLITGAGGSVGSVLLRAALADGRDALGTRRPDGQAPRQGRAIPLELQDDGALRRIVREQAPRAVLHLAAVTSVAEVAADPEAARAVNVRATRQLARAAADAKARFVFASTDLVFDGEHAPYDEQASPCPTTTYGRTKAEAEREVLDVGGVVVRLPWMYGLAAADRRPGFFAAMVEALRRGETLHLFEDEYRTPLWYEDAARALLRIADADCSGVLHLAGPERLSRLEIGRLTARALGIAQPSLIATRRADASGAEPRPRDCSLCSERYASLFGEPPGRAMPEALAIIAREFDGTSVSK